MNTGIEIQIYFYDSVVIIENFLVFLFGNLHFHKKVNKNNVTSKRGGTEENDLNMRRGGGHE